MWPTVLPTGAGADPRHAGLGSGVERGRVLSVGGVGLVLPGRGTGVPRVSRSPVLSPAAWCQAGGSASPAPAGAAPRCPTCSRLVALAREDVGGQELHAGEPGLATAPRVGGAGARPGSTAWFRSRWCLLLASRSCCGGESEGPRREQGTSHPRQSAAKCCQVSPSPWGTGTLDILWAPARWWQWPVPHAMGLSESWSARGLVSLSQSSPSLSWSLSGWEPLRTSPPLGGKMEATFGSCPFADASSCAVAWDSGLWWSPGVPRLPWLHVAVLVLQVQPGV